MYVNLIIVILSLGGTASLYVFKVLSFSSPWTYIIPLPVFIGFIVTLELLFLLWGLASTLFVNKKKEYFKVNRYFKFLVNVFMGWLCNSARLKMQINGKKIVPKDERYLLVQNHLSNYDPIVTYYYFKKPHLAFISKISNLSIPIAGPSVRALGFLPIDRENPRNAMKTIIRAADKLKENDYSYGVYPEGTRNKEAKGLLEFKHGCLKIALRAEKPIVVTTIWGTQNIHKNFPWKRTKVRLDILKVITYEEYKDMSGQELADYIKSVMQENLDKVTREF